MFNAMNMEHCLIVCVFGFREGTLVYREEALALQRQLSHLQSQFDMLSGQGSALTQGRRPRLAATSIVKGHLSNIDDSLSVRNLQASQCFHV